MAAAKLTNKITIALSVKDRHASAAWYEKHLGFQLLVHIDEADWSEMQTNTDGVTLGLGEHSPPMTGSTTPVFGVDDIATARAALENGGVKFEGETVTYDGMVSLATFYDPDGNMLMIAQDLS